MVAPLSKPTQIASDHHLDTIVIGAGLSGLTAAAFYLIETLTSNTHGAIMGWVPSPAHLAAWKFLADAFQNSHPCAASVSCWALGVLTRRLAGGGANREAGC